MAVGDIRKSSLADYAGLVVVGLLCFWAVFFDGYPIGDDYKNQIIAFEAFREQIEQGVLYPRWLQDINHGFGGANLFFYAPLIYYVEYVIDILLPFDAPTTTILSLNALFFLLFSGFSCRLWLLGFCSRWGAFAGAALYMAAPYHLFIDLYERNNGAESAVYAWTPLLLMLLQADGGRREARIAKFGAIYALFVVTHLPSAVVVTPFAGAWALLYAFMKHEGPRPELFRVLGAEGLHFAVSLGLGVLIAGLYLYPALTLLDLVRSHVMWSGPFYDYKNWFIWGGDRCPEVFGGFCMQMSLVATGTVFVPVLGCLAVSGHMSRHAKAVMGALAILIVACFFLMTPLSLFVWEFVTPLQKVQFPFRLMVVADLLFAGLIGLLFTPSAEAAHRFKVHGARICVFMVLAFLSFHTARFVQNSPHPDQEFFDYRIKHRILTGEFFPNNPEMTINILDFVDKTPALPLYRTEPETIKVALVERTPRQFTFAVEAERPGVLYVRQFYFPGWAAEIIRDGKEPGPPEIRAVEPYGQVSLALPKGHYQVRLFMSRLPQELIGGLMSLCGLVLMLLLFFSERFKRRRSR